MKYLLILVLLFAGCSTSNEPTLYQQSLDRSAAIEAEAQEARLAYENRPKVDTLMRVSDENLEVEIQMANFEDFRLTIHNKRDQVTVVTELVVTMHRVLTADGKEYVFDYVFPMVTNSIKWKDSGSPSDQKRIPIAPRGRFSEDYEIPTKVADLDDVVFMVGYENGEKTTYVVVTTADIVDR